MKKLLLMMVFGLGLVAQPGAGRMYDQQRRIEWGVRSGAITPREANHLYARQRDIQRAFERSMRNGYGITPRERARLDAMQNALDRDIARQMRDGDRRFRNGYNGGYRPY